MRRCGSNQGARRAVGFVAAAGAAFMLASALVLGIGSVLAKAQAGVERGDSERVRAWVQALERGEDMEARQRLAALGTAALGPLGQALERAERPEVHARLSEVFELTLRSRLQELDVELEAMPEPGDGGAELEAIHEALGTLKREIEAAGYAAARELARPGSTKKLLSALAREELLDDLFQRLIEEARLGKATSIERLARLGPLAAPLLEAAERGGIRRVSELSETASRPLDPQDARRLRALARAVSERACKRYVAWLSDPDPDLRRFGREGLFGMGDLARPWLERLLTGEDPELQEQASVLLRRIEWRISETLYLRLGHLLPGFEDKPWRERRYLVYLLEKQGGAEAIPTLRRVLERDPGRGVRLMAAESLARLGDVAGFVFLARAGLEPVLQSPEIKAQIAMDQGIRYLQIGRYDRAIEEFETVLEIQPSSATALYNLACAYALKGETERACDYLERAIEAGFDDLEHMEADPDLDGIRDAARYKELLDRLRKRQASEETKQP